MCQIRFYKVVCFSSYQWLNVKRETPVCYKWRSISFASNHWYLNYSQLQCKCISKILLCADGDRFERYKYIWWLWMYLKEQRVSIKWHFIKSYTTLLHHLSFSTLCHAILGHIFFLIIAGIARKCCREASLATKSNPKHYNTCMSMYKMARNVVVIVDITYVWNCSQMNASEHLSW